MKAAIQSITLGICGFLLIVGGVSSSPAKNPDNYVTFHWNTPILTFHGPEQDGKVISGVIGGSHGGGGGGGGGAKGGASTNSVGAPAGNNDYKFDGDVYYVDSPFWENEVHVPPQQPPKDAANFFNHKNIVYHSFTGK